MSKRRKHDFYPTPSWATKVLLKNVVIGGFVLEPCSGNNDIANIVRNDPGVERVVTNDIDLTQKSQYHEDATKHTIYHQGEFDWIVTNPPFSHALPILENSLDYSLDGVAFLLRLSFLEPTYDRSPLLSEYPPNKILVLPRISFTGDGKTDSVTCAWLIWDKSGESWIRVQPKQK